MKQQINPVVGIVAVVLAVIGLVVIGIKVVNDSNSAAPPTIVKPSNPNDPKYNIPLPKGMAGTGSSNSKE